MSPRRVVRYLRRHRLVIPYVLLAIGVALAIWTARDSVNDNRRSDRHQLYVACVDRNERDQALADAIRRLARANHGPESLGREVFEALAPRDCVALYPL
jgi:hypothetical protein